MVITFSYQEEHKLKKLNLSGNAIVFTGVCDQFNEGGGKTMSY